MHWIVLVLSGLLEAITPLLLLKTDKFNDPVYTSLLLLIVVTSFLGLRFATRSIALNVAYVVWTALGIGGTVLVGYWVLNENITRGELLSLLLMLIAVIGLRVSSTTSAPSGSARQ